MSLIRKARGSTLVEVLIAIVLLGVAAAAMAQLQANVPPMHEAAVGLRIDDV